MSDTTVTVRFNRDGPRTGVDLDPEREYGVSVDGQAYSTFRSPWSSAELEEHIAVLRNQGGETKPDITVLNRLGRELATEVYKIKGLPARLAGKPTVYWGIDYAELAGIPWELLTQEEEPHDHLLQMGASFVRKVPAAVEDGHAQWPTGHNESLRLLFVWGQRIENDVPHEAHLAALSESCAKYDVVPVAQEIKNIDEMTQLCSGTNPHFVHILAHGGRTDEGSWGLRLKDGVVSGEQVARSLRVGGTTPALVSVAACDSANDENNTFNSVAYNLHVHGIPLVLASQFRLRKNVSVASVSTLYDRLFGGEDMIAVLEQTRRQLAPADNEGWANEVLYSRYRHQALRELSGVACQQAALRRARVISRTVSDDTNAAMDGLQQEYDKLRRLIDRLKENEPVDRQALAETYGLLGSLQRRMAKLRDSENTHDLIAAADLYRKGFAADLNSHYCGINMVHLYRLAGEDKQVKKCLPIVKYCVETVIDAGTDFWAHASAGELSVYEANGKKAARHYLDFCEAVDDAIVADPKAEFEVLESARNQLDSIAAAFDTADTGVAKAARKARDVVDSAMTRTSHDMAAERIGVTDVHG